MNEKQPSAEAIREAEIAVSLLHRWDRDGKIVRLAHMLDAFAARGRWQPISEAPEGEHVLLWFPKGERGIGGVECGTFWREPDGSIECFWTHGGPNSGGDWEARDGEQPTHWQPLPRPPCP